MDSDQGKLFVGGISWETTEEKLYDYFGQYGDILQTVVMRDKTTGRPRGFGFVVFQDPSILDRVLQDKHTIDGRTVEAKKALSREEQQTNTRAGNLNPGRNSGSSGNIRTKKIFVGGLPPDLTDDGFRQYFETYGHVTDVVIMYDQNTQRPRGFGFISFDSEDAVDRVLHKTFHDLNGKQVEVKRALPKDANPGVGSRSMGGSYQGYGASGGNSNSYDNRMDSNKYGQPQSTGGGFPPYGSSGYAATGYGYGPASNGVGYGGYGSYGGANPGYGGPAAAAAAAYGNPNVTNAGYASGPPGAPRNSWGGQTPSGYGAMGYGNSASWGAPNSGAGSGGPGSTLTGQSPGAAGYGNQSYGYGNYGGNDGSYGNMAGYGAVGASSGGTPNSNAGGAGELQGSGGGYMGSGYGDANGNQGYGNAGWRSEPSQASGGNFLVEEASGTQIKSIINLKMGAITIENQIAVPFPAHEAFKILVPDASSTKKFPQAVKNTETIQGNGGPGAIQKVNFAEGSQFKHMKYKVEAIDKANMAYSFTVTEADPWIPNLDKIVYEVKVSPSSDGGSVAKRTAKYYPKENAELNEEMVKSTQQKIDDVTKVAHAFMVAN